MTTTTVLWLFQWGAKVWRAMSALPPKADIMIAISVFVKGH